MGPDDRMERQSLLSDHARNGTPASVRTDARSLADLEPYSGDRASMEIAWLRRCLPIVVQPKVDIGNGYGMVRLFFNFRQDIANPADLICELELVFEGEGSYHTAVPVEHNEVVTCCYRAKNLFQYGRTGDINHMQFRGVKLTGDGPPWRSMYTHDHCADQTWAQGNGGDCFSWCSIMKHYQKELGASDWMRQGDRPYIFINTFNHMMGARDANPKMPKFNWERYPVSRGTRDDAENYVKAHLPVKPNFYSVVACWTWCSLLGDWHDGYQDDPNDVTTLLYNPQQLSHPSAIIKPSHVLQAPVSKPMTAKHG